MIPVGFISTINALVAAANNKLGVWEILLIIAWRRNSNIFRCRFDSAEEKG